MMLHVDLRTSLPQEGLVFDRSMGDLFVTVVASVARTNTLNGCVQIISLNTNNKQARLKVQQAR